MKFLISLTLALAARTFSLLFYKTVVTYGHLNNTKPKNDYFENIHIFAFLNHTTLLEPLLFSAFPISFYFKNIRRVIIPGADITLSRPVVGKIYKFIFPQIVSISRKRDSTWDHFMRLVKENSLVVIAPEGRMKRPNGLDKHGNPMTIKGGIADIIHEKESGFLLIGHSGGLHHVQKPGKMKIGLFKTIKIHFEKVDIQEYKRLLKSTDPDFKQRVIEDLTNRSKENTPR